MNLLSLSCKKFARLLSESEDRVLTAREDSFLTSHRERCPGCSDTQESMQMSLNMLRSAVMDAPTTRSFDRRLIRKVKVQTVKDSVSYWTPALIGSVLAFLIVFASLDLLAVRHNRAGVKIPAGTAFADKPSYPTFELNTIPRFDR